MPLSGKETAQNRFITMVLCPWGDWISLAAAAVIVAAAVITAAAVVGHIAAIVSAAAEQDQQDDDPPAAVPTKTVVTHKTYLLERLAAFPLIPRYSASRKM